MLWSRKPYKGVCLTEMMSSMKPRGSTFISRNAERQTARVCACLRALRRYDEASGQRHSHSHLHVQGKPSWSSVSYQGERGVEGGRFRSCCEFGEEAEESAARQLLQRVSERRAALGGGGEVEESKSQRVRRWAEKTRRSCFPSTFARDTELSDSCL